MRESFRPGDTVQVDFPFTNAIGTARRPGLVLIDTGDNDIVVARITSLRARDEFDVEITDWSLAGLRSPSIVRTHKLTTIEKGLVEQHLGTLSGPDWARVREAVERLWFHGKTSNRAEFGSTGAVCKSLRDLMSLLLTCPNCGERSVNEFRFGGEVVSRPAPDASADQWASYFYFRPNAAGVQREWWNHRYGCRRWFFANRDTTNNEVSETFWPGSG